jgi:hypothetical protein
MIGGAYLAAGAGKTTHCASRRGWALRGPLLGRLGLMRVRADMGTSWAAGKAGRQGGASASWAASRSELLWPFRFPPFSKPFSISLIPFYLCLVYLCVYTCVAITYTP